MNVVWDIRSASSKGGGAFFRKRMKNDSFNFRNNRVVQYLIFSKNSDQKLFDTNQFQIFQNFVSRVLKKSNLIPLNFMYISGMDFAFHSSVPVPMLDTHSALRGRLIFRFIYLTMILWKNYLTCYSKLQFGGLENYVK